MNDSDDDSDDDRGVRPVLRVETRMYGNGMLSAGTGVPSPLASQEDLLAGSNSNNSHGPRGAIDVTSPAAAAAGGGGGGGRRGPPRLDMFAIDGSPSPGATNLDGRTARSQKSETQQSSGSLKHSAANAAATRQRQQQRQAAKREAKALRAAFKRFDVDKSKSISVTELSNLMEHLGYHMSLEDLQNLIQQVATDGRDELSYHETAQLMQMYREAAQFKLLQIETEPQRTIDPTLSGLQALLAYYLPMKPSDDPHVGLWECLMLLVATYLWMAGLYSTVISDTALVRWMDINGAFYFVAFLLLAADLALRRRIITVPSAYHYAALAVDAITAIPFELVAYGVVKGKNRHLKDHAADDSDVEGYAWLFAFILLKLLRLPRTWGYFRPSGLPQVNRRYIMLYAYFVPFVSVVCYMMGFTMLLTVLWVAVSSDPDITFAEALYFTSYTVTGVGYGNVPAVTTAERLIAALYCLIAQGIIAFVVGSVVNVIAESDVRGEGEHQVVQTMRICDIAGVGEGMTRDALNFQDHLVRNKLADAYGGLVSNLPPQLRDNITLFVKVRLIASDSVFLLAHRATQVALARVLESSVARPGEAIYLAGDTVTDMIFVAHGEIHVTAADGSTVSVLRSGSHVNEAALLFGAEEKVDTARCLVHCELFTLYKKAFMAIRARFPVFDIEMNRVSQFLEEKLLEQMEMDRQQSLETEASTVRCTDGGDTDAAKDDQGVASNGASAAANADGDDPPDESSPHMRDFELLDVESVAGSPINRGNVRNPLSGPAARTGVSVQASTASAAAAAGAAPGSVQGSMRRPVDFTFTTSAGKTVELRHISSTFRLAAGRAGDSAAATAMASSFRQTVRARSLPVTEDLDSSNSFAQSPVSPALNPRERLAAIADDATFGRLEAGDIGNVDDDDDADNDSATSNDLGSNQAGASSGALRGVDSTAVATEALTREHDATITECENEMSRIEALIARLHSRPSGSMLSIRSRSPGGAAGSSNGLLSPNILSPHGRAGSGAGGHAADSAPAAAAARQGSSDLLSFRGDDEVEEMDGRRAGEASGGPV